MSDVVQTIFDSNAFGDVVVTKADDRCTARFRKADSSVVTIERVGARTRRSVPIGTRDASCLAAWVNDRRMKVLPGRGRALKRSYRVVAEIDDRVLTLEPISGGASRFLNGGPREIEKSFCTFAMLNNGSVYVEWKTPTTTEALGHTVEPPQPTEEDVLTGFALVAAFGIGSLSWVEIILNFVGAFG
ncbi:hypothetical protein [Nocardia arthritidis]|uniref:Uncharacterized protein n=1 Tax=Nocardia arthritidis TaxID=228602 RepID=A0A6G9YHT1_9NOCA|nr:hypothetical protein [Nocardia arthritidis]QIS12758.1 hypothetical protein F5544_24515 [Nocardia arthritidis]